MFPVLPWAGRAFSCLVAACTLAAVLPGQPIVQVVAGAAGRGRGPGQIEYPGGVATDIEGNLFIADVYNHRIVKVATDGTATVVAGTGTPGLGEDQFTFPRTLTLDRAGNMYIADSYNHRIRRIAPGGAISNVAGTGFPGSELGQLRFPRGVAVDSDSNIFIADNYNHRIVRVTAEGVLSIYWGTGEEGNRPEQLAYPSGLAVDRAGTLYIADTLNHRVQKVTRAKVVTTVVGGPVAGPGSTQLGGPVGVDVDEAGNIYVSDTANHRIQKVAVDGSVRTIAGGPPSGDGEFQLNQPFDTALDQNGNLYIADAYNHRIERLFVPSEAPGPAILDFATNRSGPGSPNLLMRVVPAPACSGAIGVLAGGFPAVASSTSAGIVFAMPESVDPGRDTEIYVLCGGAVIHGPLPLSMTAVRPKLFANWASLAIGEQADTYQEISRTRPATVGSVVALYGTGFGLLDAERPGGTRAVKAPVSVTIAGRAAELYYAGSVPGQSLGLIQLNVRIPADLSDGIHEIQVMVDGRQTQGGVFLPVIRPGN